MHTHLQILIKKYFKKLRTASLPSIFLSNFVLFSEHFYKPTLIHMKKILLSFVMLFAAASLIAQNVPREMVAAEDGTGTWCQYCPGAAMGCDDLLSNGKLVAVIANHNGDTYANNYSNNRNTMWGISGFPTVTFDGIKAVVGGNHTSSLYTSYLPLYNTCIAVTSPVSMTMDVTNSGLNYTVVVTLTKVGSITSTNNILFFFVTQSHITQNWQGQTHLEHVNRLMAPDQNGTPVDFTSGNTQTVTLNFAMNAAWPLADCEFIAMLQDKDAGQGTIPGGSVKKWTVYQCIKRGVIDLSPDFAASATQINKGTTVNFTNNTTGGYIGVPETYEWQFPGATPDTSSMKNPSVVYNECGPHDVILTVNRGGQIITSTKTAYINVGPIAQIAATPGDTACPWVPITLDATTTGATYMWTPGGATTPSITLDEATLGLGAHTYTVTVSANGCDNTANETIYFDACLGIIPVSGNALSIYPNPNHGTFSVEINANGQYDLKVVNALNTVVFQEKGITVNGKTLKDLNLNLSAGMYYIILQNGTSRSVQKLSVN
jgi:hypothetical protein